MINLYKRCEKSIDNPYGIIKINHIDEINKPFLLCISSLENDDNSVFGIIKEGARACRVRTPDELSAGYKIDEMPVDFLGIKNEKDGNFKNLDEVIIGLLLKDKDINNIYRRARMMNFFTYCNATSVYTLLEKRIIDYLKNDDFSDREISDILSQISLISIASEIDVLKVKATNIIFKDANDIDVYDYISKTAYKKMEKLGRNSYVNKMNQTLIYAYNGTGEHELKQYFKDISIVKSALCACVSKLIENSIINYNSDMFIPLKSEEILKVIIRHNSEFTSNDVELSKLDNNLNYGNVGKYSIEEHNDLLNEEKNYKGKINLKHRL